MSEETTKIRTHHTLPSIPIRLIKLYSFLGDTVLDPFAGTGTTLLAAQELGRKSIGFELNSEYIKLIKNKLNPIVSQQCLFTKEI